MKKKPNRGKKWGKKQTKHENAKTIAKKAFKTTKLTPNQQKEQDTNTIYQEKKKSNTPSRKPAEIRRFLEKNRLRRVDNQLIAAPAVNGQAAEYYAARVERVGSERTHSSWPRAADSLLLLTRSLIHPRPRPPIVPIRREDDDCTRT